MTKRYRYRRGFPKDLEEETYNALSEIYCRYLQIGAKHMSRDRIVSIMNGALSYATRPITGDNEND